MRLEHFQRLQPICPVCASSSGSGTTSSSPHHKLSLQSTLLVQGEHVVEGILQCTNPSCCSEFPIIDGIPIILARLRSYIAENIFPITARLDLSEQIESLLGDCCSQGSALDALRQNASCYAWDHYAEFDPQDAGDHLTPGSIVRVLRRAFSVGETPQAAPTTSNPAATQPLPSGPTLDLGCSVGRSSFELAAQGDDLVLGVDLNFAMLRLAAGVLRHSVLTYSRRRVGLVYDRRTFAVEMPHASRVDFWACDATALPFADSTFTNCVALNVLDSVPSPPQLISSIGRVLRPGGQTILGCPYDWSIHVTPVESWLGGHSQRGRDAGDAVPSVRRLLQNAPSAELASFEILAEHARVPWTIRMHDRSHMTYQVHLLRARKAGLDL